MSRNLREKFDRIIGNEYDPRPVPLINHATREIQLKVVYYGPGLGGKTTNLEFIHGRSRPENRGKLISLATEAERTLFFDLLPVHLGKYRGYTVRLHLCTVPGQIALDSTRKLVLKNVDGVVFVVDSQAGRIESNVESMANLETNLRMQGDDPRLLPLVVQFNKRDLEGALSVAELEKALDIPADVTRVEASAKLGVGVFETLKAITTAVLHLVGDPKKLADGRSPSVLPKPRIGMSPGAQDAYRVKLPTSPRLPRVPDEK